MLCMRSRMGVKIYGAGYGGEFLIVVNRNVNFVICDFCDLRHDGAAVYGNLEEDERNGCRETMPGR